MKKIYALGVLLFFSGLCFFLLPRFFGGGFEEFQNDAGDYVSAYADKASQKLSSELAPAAAAVRENINAGAEDISRKGKALGTDYVYDPLKAEVSHAVKTLIEKSAVFLTSEDAAAVAGGKEEENTCHCR